MMQGNPGTLIGLLLRGLKTAGDAPVLRWKRYGLWHHISGTELITKVETLSRGLRRAGLLAEGETAAIYAGNGCEWVIADLAVMRAGGVSAGLDCHAGEAELKRALNETGARVLFVEGERRIHAARAVRQSCPALRHLVLLREDWSADDIADGIPTLDGIAAQGARDGDDDPLPPAPHAPAVIMMSSGTTRPAHGTELSHRGLAAQVARAAGALDLHAGDERLALTPMHHVLERVVGIYASLARGAVINFAESADTALANLAELQPSIVQAPPRVWGALRKSVLLNLGEATRLQRWAYRVAMAFSRRARSRSGAWVALVNAIGDRLVRRPLRQRLGIDGARLCLTSGAAWHPEVVEWYRDLGREMTDVYGLAEAGGAVAITPLSGRGLQTAQLLDGIEAMLSETRELLVRAQEVLGTRGRPDAWIASGDAAGSDGSLAPAARMDDLLRRSGGGHVLPRAAERALKASPYIADAVLTPGQEDRTRALVLIDYDQVVKFAQDRGVPFTHFRSLCLASEIRDLIRDAVAQANAAQSDVVIDSFELIERPLGPGDPAVGPALTLRRHVLLAESGGSPPGNERARVLQTAE